MTSITEPATGQAREAVRRHFERAAIGIALLLLSPMGAWSRPMQMMDSFPAAQAIVDGNNEKYVVRFDGPVDHRTSRMWLTQSDRAFRTLTPLLDSAPTVLFASSSRLPPGSYQLHWSVRSMPDGELTDGTIQFTCGGGR
jgi:methionine-rich copper-binding protein CopC